MLQTAIVFLLQTIENYRNSKLDIRGFVIYPKSFNTFFREIVMASMKPRISVEYAENATVITFTDEKILEEKDVQAIQESIMSVIESASDGIKLILDFSNVQFLSSAVLGLLIRISKKVYEHDGQLKLCSINPKIYKIFKITRLTKIFDIYDDIGSATESLSTAG